MSQLIAQANVFHIPLPDESVHCIVTSPPYHGLRKYAGNQGATPLGLEATEELHLERMRAIGKELWRVLRPDGVLWWNYADAFTDGSLSGMAWRIALSFKEDGWILRNDVIFSKPNPMPESVAGWRWERERRAVGNDPRRPSAPTLGQPPQRQHDGPDLFAKPEYEYGDELELRRGSWRHTRSHEYVFMLTKQMQYWSDQEAAREALQQPDAHGMKFGGVKLAGGNNPGTYSGKEWDARVSAGRNPRSVLHIPTAPYRGAHYATFPCALIAPLILATCPRWCCPVCGRGWAPVVEKGELIGCGGSDKGKIASNDQDKAYIARFGHRLEHHASNVLGYRLTCDHVHTQAEAVPGIVFDPFVGSGTTVMVARQLLRRGIGFDISRPYLDEQALLRTGLGTPSHALDDLPLFAELE